MSEEPFQTLQHEAEPGYRFAFLVAFGVLGLYLAAILVSSPGPASHSHKKPAATSPTAPSTLDNSPNHEAH